MKKNLTEAFVQKIKAADTRIDYWDPELKGFGLRVSKNGIKSWCAIYRFDGVQKRFTIGTYPTFRRADARRRAREVLLGAQTRKADAAAEKKANRAAGTFGELATEYLAYAAQSDKKTGQLHKRTWEVDKAMIERDLSAWNNRRLKSIKRADVRAVMDAITKRGSLIMANRVLALISSMFNFEIGRSDDDLANPAFKFPKHDENKRTRVLSDDEIRKLWKALDSKPQKQAAFVRLCLLTGQRAREVLQIALAEVDFELGIWTIPGERTKNELAHKVPLAPTAMNLIEGLKNGTPFLFPSPRPSRPMSQFRRWIDTLRDDLKFEPDWTCHTLRHTMRSRLSELHVLPHVAEATINHSQRGIAGTYDHFGYLDEKRDALTRWDSKLTEIVSHDVT